LQGANDWFILVHSSALFQGWNYSWHLVYEMNHILDHLEMLTWGLSPCYSQREVKKKTQFTFETNVKKVWKLKCAFIELW
jgi:hypothetical protein